MCFYYYVTYFSTLYTYLSIKFQKFLSNKILIQNFLKFYNLKRRPLLVPFYTNSYIYIFTNYLLFTKSFNALPALNTGAFEAGILISSLVWGFLPFLAALFLTSKEPNPTNWTLSPSTNASVTVSTNALTVASATFFVFLFLQLLLRLIQLCSFKLPPIRLNIYVLLSPELSNNCTY